MNFGLTPILHGDCFCKCFCFMVIQLHFHFQMWVTLKILEDESVVEKLYTQVNQRLSTELMS